MYSGLYLHTMNNLVYGGCNVCNLLDQSETMIQLHVWWMHFTLMSHQNWLEGN